jgi:hypothetical protein
MVVARASMAIHTRKYAVLATVLAALLGATGGYFYATAHVGRLLSELECLNQANKVALGLQTIELVNAGNVVAIKTGQERLIRLAVISLRSLDVHPDLPNKVIVADALRRLKDYQVKTSGAVDPDVELLLERLKGK